MLVLLGLRPASAQQLWKIHHNTIFLPQDGLAIDTLSGRLLWRYPRFQGTTASDGAGLLLVSYLSGINDRMHYRSTRLCRLNAQNGREIWCREFVELNAWVIDADHRRVYVLHHGRLDMLEMEHGHAASSFLIRNGQSDLYALPQGGLLLLDSGPTHTIAGVYHPGDAQIQWRKFPMYLQPFHGEGGGLLLYASEQGKFFSPSLRPVYQRLSVEDYPKAGADGEGFVFTDQQDRQLVLRGGAYDGPLWASTPANPSSLMVRDGMAIVLEPVQDSSTATQTRLRLLDLPTGHLRQQIDLPAGLRVADCDERELLLQDDAHLLLVDLKSGTVRWQIDQSTHSALLTDEAVVFWNAEGKLLGRARSNGALLWRDQFRFKQTPH